MTNLTLRYNPTKDNKVYFNVFLGRKHIGDAFKCDDGDYESVIFNSDIGHSMIDTLEEAIFDVVSVHQENVRCRTRW